MSQVKAKGNISLVRHNVVNFVLILIEGPLAGGGPLIKAVFNGFPELFMQVQQLRQENAVLHEQSNSYRQRLDEHDQQTEAQIGRVIKGMEDLMQEQRTQAMKISRLILDMAKTVKSTHQMEDSELYAFAENANTTSGISPNASAKDTENPKVLSICESVQVVPLASVSEAISAEPIDHVVVDRPQTPLPSDVPLSIPRKLPISGGPSLSEPGSSHQEPQTLLATNNFPSTGPAPLLISWVTTPALPSSPLSELTDISTPSQSAEKRKAEGLVAGEETRSKYPRLSRPQRKTNTKL